ncbi:hypothetical protein GWK47_043853 [Chionoecetes opilio]|uniref:Uncharacterized protein n=1 Tax=Chionoecetes opilio TaxID=41210 RepID=A0A8J4YGL1_CHIOP|nr:hypothetical protein GWK47_043853 [Chionoecetes opilio]
MPLKGTDLRQVRNIKDVKVRSKECLEAGAKYEDVVPIPVPDVAFSLKPEPPKPARRPSPNRPNHSPRLHVMPMFPQVETRQVPSSLTNGDVTPIEIPEGIPLLARILPPKEPPRDASYATLYKQQ